MWEWIFCNSQFLIKLKFLRYIIRSFIFYLFNNTKIFELCKTGVLVSFEIPICVTLDLHIFLKKCPSYYFNKCTINHLTWKSQFWGFKRCLLAHFKYREIYLTWQFPFPVFKRCLFQMCALLFFILSIKKVLGDFG